MSGHATTRRLTVEEYLSDPELEKLELVDGVAVEPGMGSKKHSVTQTACAYLLEVYVRSRQGYYAATGLRCRLQVGAHVRFRLPDVCIVEGRSEDGDPPFLDGAPLFVVEIRSPEKTIAEQLRKLDEYLERLQARLADPSGRRQRDRPPGRERQDFRARRKPGRRRCPSRAEPRSPRAVRLTALRRAYTAAPHVPTSASAPPAKPSPAASPAKPPSASTRTAPG